ncbi:hypothetical protein B0H16DRAFT_157937 [Mycena metata]|uniref:Uncharacterized protein n=1 Tax=Mycena metata TaxID=1033252 RepID=A0AAD7I4J7_9AGAR|nr:hypothetical protein B0H16DRAFT_157937 [Mycena metata]
MHDPSTAKNVVYHRAWTEVNYDDSSVAKYIKFINANITAKGGVDHWNWTFNIACNLESQLFNTGLRAPTPFEIIPNGTYSIHTSSAKSLVLAVQDVTGFLRPPADKVVGGYLPSNAASVVGKEKTGGDHEKWLISATKTGCTFKNVGTGLYLGTSAQLNRGEYRVLQAVSDPYCWWINPSSNQGPSVYQIYDSANLRYTLHAAIEALNDIVSTDFPFIPIIAHENSDASCQMWLFNEAEFKQTERTQIYADDDKLAEPRSAEPGENSQQADATIKQLEVEKAVYLVESNILRKKLEEVRLALDTDESKNLPTAIMILRNTIERLTEGLIEADDDRVQEGIQPYLWERMKRKHICHWEDLIPSVGLKFDAASLYLTPIEVGNENGRPTFILRTKGHGNNLPSLQLISDDWPFHADNISGDYKYEVLVGDSSRLSWIPIDESRIPNDGPPKVKSLDHKPVTARDVALREYNETLTFIGRYSYLGNFYASLVGEGSIRLIEEPPRGFRNTEVSVTLKTTLIRPCSDSLRYCVATPRRMSNRGGPIEKHLIVNWA